MGEAPVFDYERYGKKTPPRRLDNDRGTGEAIPQSTNGTDTNYKNPPDRGGDGPSSES